MTGRPRSCECGTCDKCKRATYMRAWWQRQAPEKKRAYLDRRLKVRGEAIREADRQRYVGGKRPGARAPEKVHALKAVHQALSSGRLERQPCEVCGVAKVDAHHENYSAPLDVRWLCRKHHMELHRKYRVAA